MRFFLVSYLQIKAISSRFGTVNYSVCTRNSRLLYETDNSILHCIGVRMNGHKTLFVVALLFVLFLAAAKPWTSATRSTSWGSASGSLTRRELQSTQRQGLALEMMHVHHVDLPYAPLDVSLAERLRSAAQKSKARAQFINARKLGKQQTTDVLSLPIYEELGGYFVNFGLGTPSRTIRATADTGSDLMWVQCSRCNSCLDEPDPLFNPESSSSYEPIPCSGTDTCQSLDDSGTCSGTDNGTCMFTYGYGDGSLDTGDLATETLTLIDTTGTALTFPDIDFGCAHFANGSEVGDGLVGLGLGNISLVQQLGSEIGHIFSYCLVDFVSARNRTSTLLLGSGGNVPLNYTPMLMPSATFYYLNVIDIRVDGTSIDYPADTFAIVNGGFIVDSGTTITQLDMRAYNPLLESLDSLISYPIVDDSNSTISQTDLFAFDYCANVSDVSNPTFPTLSFHFDGGVDMVLPTDNVFVEVIDNLYCLQISSAPEGSGSIFGNIQQQNFQIAFDIGKERIGFAPKKC